MYLDQSTEKSQEKVIQSKKSKFPPQEVLTMIEILGFKPEQFTQQQLQKLALCHLRLEEGSEINTNLEDAFELAIFVKGALKLIEDVVGPLAISNQTFAYAFFNHDIGKGGEHPGETFAKLFAIKNEKQHFERKRIPLPEGGLQIQEVLEAYDLQSQHVASELEQEGVQIKASMRSLYDMHEKKLSVLDESLPYSKFTPTEQQQIRLIARGHHVDRYQDELLQLNEQQRKLVMVADILDKIQAFMVRPSLGLDITHQLLSKYPSKLKTPLDTEYKALAKQMFHDSINDVTQSGIAKRIKLIHQKKNALQV